MSAYVFTDLGGEQVSSEQRFGLYSDSGDFTPKAETGPKSRTERTNVSAQSIIEQLNSLLPEERSGDLRARLPISTDWFLQSRL